jgi:hypothetical protein
MSFFTATFRSSKRAANSSASYRPKTFGSQVVKAGT